MPLISPHAMIDSSAKLADDVVVGPFAVIGPNVTIGAGSKVAAHAVIHCNTRIGERTTIDSFASIGGDPQDLTYQGEETWLEIGNDNKIREYASINRGSSKGGLTKIGDRNFILAYSHIAHDCQLGNEIVCINNASLAGHVVIENCAILGAFTAVHQFCRVGSYSFLSRATEISKDIPPYMLVKGIPGFPCGLNLVGLKRRGFTAEQISYIKKAYKIMYRSSLKLREIQEELQVLATDSEVIQFILDFMGRSERGIARRTHD